MATPAYILGALDALVKAGEVSPAYALGVSSVLEKSAGLVWDSSYNDTVGAYAQWRKANPDKALTPDIARQFMRDNAYNWYNIDKDRVSTWDWAKNRIGKYWNKTWWGNDNKTSDMYDRELELMRNKGSLSRLKEWEGQGKALPPELAGALQDAFHRDAQFVSNDAKKYMNHDEIEAAGYGDGLANTFNTQAGNAAINSGMYKGQFAKPNTPAPDSTQYGKNLAPQYGANKDLFYKRDYFDPTAI